MAPELSNKRGFVRAAQDTMGSFHWFSRDVGNKKRSDLRQDCPFGYSECNNHAIKLQCLFVVMKEPRKQGTGGLTLSNKAFCFWVRFTGLQL